MLIQDLLVTLPGLLGSASRIDGIDAARQSGASSTSLLVAQPAASQTLSLSGSPAQPEMAQTRMQTNAGRPMLPRLA